MLIGYKLNNLEILTDFNGWSWDKTYDEQFDYIDNLIYQNLLVILGDKFLCDWRNDSSGKRDFLSEIDDFIRYFTNNNEYLKSLYKMLYLKDPLNNQVNQVLKNNKKILKKMENKIKFINDVNERKKKINKRLNKIDIMLNDYKYLEKELIKVNSKLDETHKIKSIKKYKEILTLEKKKYLNEITQIDYILKPQNFFEVKEILEQNIKICECGGTFEDSLINCQRQFIHFIDKKLNKMKTRDEIIDVIYEIRYYKTLKISKDTKISDIKQLNSDIDKVLKKAITMLCKIGAINIISMDIDLNFEIIKYAIDTKIIDLEKIKLYFEKEDENNLIIKVFDKETIEKQGRKKISVENKTLAVKQKKKIKLFN